MVLNCILESIVASSPELFVCVSPCWQFTDGWIRPDLLWSKRWKKTKLCCSGSSTTAFLTWIQRYRVIHFTCTLRPNILGEGCLCLWRTFVLGNPPPLENRWCVHQAWVCALPHPGLPHSGIARVTLRDALEAFQCWIEKNGHWKRLIGWSLLVLGGGGWCCSTCFMATPFLAVRSTTRSGSTSCTSSPSGPFCWRRSSARRRRWWCSRRCR